jgi:vacuolar-type H+-ATPase subunit H
MVGVDLPPDVSSAPSPASEVHQELANVVALVSEARAMPLSSSCLIDRSEVLGSLTRLGELLPRELASAKEVIGDAEHLVAAGRAEAERLVAEAREERNRMVGRTELVQHARSEARRIVEEATAEAGEMRKEVEDYVDGKLANFEVVLHKTLSAVERGREKLKGRSELDAIAGVGDDPDDAFFTGELPAVTG